MLETRWLRALLLALPGLVLAGFGAVHPSGLNADNAHWWANLHILLLPVFPLLAAAQWHLLTPAHPAVRWAGRLATFGFAAFYTGLDAVAGIAAGTVTDTQHGYSPAVGQLFAVGDMLGYIGAWGFLVASVLIVAGIAPRAGWRVAPGAVVMLLASVSFLDSHIFWPRGVYTMVGVAAGMFLLSYHGKPLPAPGGEPRASARS
jgi:hypothetical protein